MKHEDQSFSSFLHILRRHARPALLAAFAVLLGMTYFVFAMPAVYQSSASLQIVQPEVAPDSLGATTAREYVEQRPQRARQRVLTLANFNDLAKRYKLYQDKGESTLSEEEALATFTSNVVVMSKVTSVIDPRSMRAGDLAYGFEVGFRHGDPVVSRDITNDLAQLFIESSVQQTQADATRAIDFLRSDADRLEIDLRQREERLAEFRRAYGAGLPENLNANRERVRELEHDLARVDDDLREARARKNLLETQLHDTPAQRLVIDATGLLLTVLYNCGARVSELIGLRRTDLVLDPTASVKILGKGRKERAVPLRPQTRAAAASVTARDPVRPTHPAVPEPQRPPNVARQSC